MFIKRDEILFLFFLTCALIQLWRNIGKHLDYKYKIIPIMSIKRNMDLPVVSLCVSTFIDEVKFQKRYPALANEIGDLKFLKRKSVRRKLYNLITLKELNLVSFDLNQILQSCLIYDNQMTKVNCTYLSPYVSWISFEDKCFQFFAFRGQFKKRFIYNRDSLVNQEWLVFTIRKDLIRKQDIGIIVSSPNEILQPYSYNTGYIKFSLSLLDTIYIVIEKYQTISLPKPYESDCKNYTDGHSPSQMHCLYDCYYHKFKHLGKYPDQLLSRFPENLFGINLDKYNRTECALKECPKRDCVIDRFQLGITYKKLSGNQTTARIVLKNSFSEHRLIKYEPLNHNKNILSLVSFILSPLAFYTGVSLYTLHIYSINLIVYLIAFAVKIKNILY